MQRSATSTDGAAPVADALPAVVQHNCDLADALHAREKSLCTYLLGMREYYRWQARLPLDAAPDRAALTGWVGERERRWEELREGAAIRFAPLPLAGGIDAFDEDAANRRLAANGLVYGAGIGLFGAPVFFLAARLSEQQRDGARIVVAGGELARGFVAPPAASRAGAVIVRLDALRRWLWTRAEAARRGPPGNAFAAALRAYGDPDELPVTVERMAQGEVESLVLHELGELRAASLLGGEWEEMLGAIEDRRAELTVRAVRDLLADCLVTLPALLDRRSEASLLVWLAGFDGLRRLLAPELATPWRAADRAVDRDVLARAARRGAELWLDAARQLLASWRSGGQPELVAQAARLAPMH